MYTCSFSVFYVHITFISTNKMFVCFNLRIMSRNRLTSSQIAGIINGLESENDLDFSGDSESDFCPKVDEISSSDEGDSEDRGERPMDLNDQSVENPDVNMVDGKTKRQKELNRGLIWKQGNLILNDHQMQFRGNTSFHSEIMELELPIEYFFHLFPKSLFEEIKNETNLYVCISKKS